VLRNAHRLSRRPGQCEDLARWRRRGPQIAFARQSLSLIINHGRLNPALNDSSQWGYTLGNAVRVWRTSGNVPGTTARVSHRSARFTPRTQAPRAGWTSGRGFRLAVRLTKGKEHRRGDAQRASTSSSSTTTPVPLGVGRCLPDADRCSKIAQAHPVVAARASHSGYRSYHVQ
jgi:hypothetical protein